MGCESRHTGAAFATGRNAVVRSMCQIVPLGKDAGGWLTV